MKLAEILLEGYRQELDGESQVLSVLEKNCSRPVFETPCWRGAVSSNQPAYIFHGESGSRVSKNASNHYTLLLDNFLPKQFPRRSASLICMNNRGRSYAKIHSGKNGAMYAIIPFKGVVAGVLSVNDIWLQKLTLGDATKTLSEWAELMSKAGIPDTSYSKLYIGLKQAIYNPYGAHARVIQKAFDGIKSIDKELKRAFSPENLNIAAVVDTELPKLNDKEREVWIGGKCLAIREDIWEKLKNEAK